jgi:peptidyl-prolyl cis-trans isomerase SDCCAG10
MAIFFTPPDFKLSSKLQISHKLILICCHTSTFHTPHKPHYRWTVLLRFAYTEAVTMSSLYATEPATAGRVIFETTHGPLDILLWCRECPATTRFFLQLCLDGFYDNMIFHRIVPSLLIQTGAIRGNSEPLSLMDGGAMAKYRTSGHADEALERRQYEVNPRIRFGHRGQVAMALGVSDIDDVEDLQPQFFITTEDAPYLDGKHVVFGTLGVGPTMFNAIRIVQYEVDETTNTPVDLENAPRILSTKILENPIHENIQPQLTLPWRPQIADAKKRKKRKGKLDVNVLSFGDEMEDIAPKSVREKASKDSRKTTHNRNESPDKAAPRKMVAESAPNGAPVDSNEKPNPSVAINNGKVTERIVESLAPKLRQRTPPPVEAKPAPPKSLSLVEERRAKYAKGGKTKQQREEETLAKLMAFRGKIHRNVAPDSDVPVSRDDSLAARMARRALLQEQEKRSNDDGVSYSGQVLEDEDDDDDTSSSWLQTRFKCRKHMDHLAGDGRNAEDYAVIDDRRASDDGNRAVEKRYKKHHKRGER